MIYPLIEQAIQFKVSELICYIQGKGRTCSKNEQKFELNSPNKQPKHSNNGGCPMWLLSSVYPIMYIPEIDVTAGMMPILAA